jgi:hypothetical protein
MVLGRFASGVLAVVAGVMGALVGAPFVTMLLVPLIAMACGTG